MLAEIDVLQQLLNGGIIAYLLIFLSVLLLTLAIVHAISLRFNVQCPFELLESVTDKVGRRQFDGAIRVVESDSSVLARVVEPALRGRSSDARRMRELVSDAVAEQSLHLGHRVGWVGVVAAVAPMLGLLGTISGMVSAFAAMSASSGATDPAVLAGAISEALVTTYLGLVVAIPALVIHAALRQRVLSIVLRAGEMGEQLVTTLSQSGQGSTRRSRIPERTA